MTIRIKHYISKAITTTSATGWLGMPAYQNAWKMLLCFWTAMNNMSECGRIHSRQESPTRRLLSFLKPLDYSDLRPEKVGQGKNCRFYGDGIRVSWISLNRSLYLITVFANKSSSNSHTLQQFYLLVSWGMAMELQFRRWKAPGGRSENLN